jgi:hypothetical protein
MSEDERLPLRRRTHRSGARTGMTLHFMLMKARHQERIANWQVDRGRPYWRRAPRPQDWAAPMGAYQRAFNYARQNRCAPAQAAARASAAEGLVLFHSAQRARDGLLRLRFTHAQIRSLLKRQPRMLGARPIYKVIDEVRDVSA